MLWIQGVRCVSVRIAQPCDEAHCVHLLVRPVGVMCMYRGMVFDVLCPLRRLPSQNAPVLICIVFLGIVAVSVSPLIRSWRDTTMRGASLNDVCFWMASAICGYVSRSLSCRSQIQ